MSNALGCYKISEDEDWWGELKRVSLPFKLTQYARKGLRQLVGTLRFVVSLHIVSSFSFGPKYDAFRSLQDCIILAWTLWLSLALLHYATWLSPSSPLSMDLLHFSMSLCPKTLFCPRPNGSVGSCYYLSWTLDLFCDPSEVLKN